MWKTSKITFYKIYEGWLQNLKIKCLIWNLRKYCCLHKYTMININKKILQQNIWKKSLEQKKIHEITIIFQYKQHVMESCMARDTPEHRTLDCRHNYLTGQFFFSDCQCIFLTFNKYGQLGKHNFILRK